MKTILFVCTGNTCRSSMAEAIMKKMVESRKELKGKIKVVSAGIAAFPREKASAQAIHVMGERGIDLQSHRARSLDGALVREADIILTMTERHKQAIVEMVQEAGDKVYTLKEFYHRVKPEEEYDKEMDKLCEDILDKRDQFFRENHQEIQRLKDLRKELQAELQKVEDALRQWDRKLEEKIQNEKRKLMELQRRKDPIDILDPFGQPIDTYRQCADEIEGVLDGIFDELVKEEKAGS